MYSRVYVGVNGVSDGVSKQLHESSQVPSGPPLHSNFDYQQKEWLYYFRANITAILYHQENEFFSTSFDFGLAYSLCSNCFTIIYSNSKQKFNTK
jgi:hypothetical protein